MFQNIKFWFLCRFVPRHRYNVIHTKLEPGYYDIDEVMLHGMFALLDRYVEIEKGGQESFAEFIQSISEDGDITSQLINDTEALVLYRWWHDERPLDIAKEKELFEKLYMSRERIENTETALINGYVTHIVPPPSEEENVMYDEHQKLQDKIASEEQEMLHRLIDIRRSLWT